MSEQNNAPENSAIETPNTIVEEKAKPVEMTAENFKKWEHNVQVGITKVMPDNTSIADYQKDVQRKQREQDEARIEAAKPKKKAKDGVVTIADAKPETPLNVTVHANGAVSAEPKVVETEVEKPAPNTGDDGEPQEPENDIPSDYPGRKALLAAGHVNLETVAKFTLDDLTNITGIRKPTAEKILAYGKSV